MVVNCFICHKPIDTTQDFYEYPSGHAEHIECVDPSRTPRDPALGAVPLDKPAEVNWYEP